MTGPTSHRLRRALTGAALAGTLLALTGCASSVDPIERLGRKAAERMGTRDGATVAEAEAATVAEGEAEAEAATVAEGTSRAGGEPVRPARADDLGRRDGHAD
ncbi:hypothetical protein ASC82_22035 [Streptomyces sp. Root431]|uniref:hypothetical protein n=1 Tax=Streptomyces sp. Root431 TaxID=1736535 RepID=UPI0006F83D97|nr:hypothetical protein [Streptomyces sp. Root431]KQX10371.1 hypothetical protein ASC82_22035 [Streptomyces sp. Root431]